MKSFYQSHRIDILPKRVQAFSYVVHATEALSLLEALKDYRNKGEALKETKEAGEAFLCSIGYKDFESNVDDIPFQTLVLMKNRIDEIRASTLSALKPLSRSERTELSFSIRSAVLLIDDRLQALKQDYSRTFRMKTGVDFGTTIKRFGKTYFLTGSIIESAGDTFFEFAGKDSEPVYLTSNQFTKQNEQS